MDIAVQIGAEFKAHLLGVGKGEMFVALLQEKIEGIDNRHVGYQIDLDFKPARGFRKHQPRDVIAVGVLLPVDEVLFRRHLQRVRQDRGARVGGGAQAYHMRGQGDVAVVVITGFVMQCNPDCHVLPFWPVRKAGGKLDGVERCNASLQHTGIDAAPQSLIREKAGKAQALVVFLLQAAR